MSFVAQPIPAGWGADTIHTFSARDVAMLKAGQYQGHAMTFLWRYGSDVSIVERDAILPVMPMVLVEHVQRPGWQTGGALGGKAAGERDVYHADRLEYPKGAHLCFDLEGVGDQGVSVEEYIMARCAVVRAAGYLPAAYEGYDDGLTMVLRLAISGPDGVDVWWSDFGHRTPPPGIGFVCTQHPQTVVAGIQIDPDECHGFDLRGRQLVGMWLVADENVATSDPVGPESDTLPPTPNNSGV